MLLRKKLSTLVLCTVLVGSSVTGIGATTKDSIIGANRYETAAKIADRIGSYNTAILVNSDKSLADGLSASSLAGKEKAPILLVQKDSIPKETLSRLGIVDKVYIIGGTSAISEKVESQLAGKTIERIEGKDRVDTSRKVAELVGNYKEAFIVNGFKGEADAMSVASVAARDKAPILLTDGTKTEHEFKSDVEYFVIGGNKAVSNLIMDKYEAKRIGGSDRYDTNRKVFKTFYINSEKIYYTKGDVLVDALTSSYLSKDSGILFISPTSDNSIMKSANEIIQVGGMEFDLDSSDMSVKEYFVPMEIPEHIKRNMIGVSMPENNDIKFDDLRFLNVKYYGYDGKIHNDGKIIVNKKVAKEVGLIFRELMDKKYPIEKINLIDEYGANDEKSMTANNTSAFCYRKISGSSKLSKHSYGMAIDINPKVNPQVTNGKVYPSSSYKYSDRKLKEKGMIHKNDVCYNIFMKYGWKWGGNWKSTKDYQHFEKK